MKMFYRITSSIFCVLVIYSFFKDYPIDSIYFASIIALLCSILAKLER